MYLNRLLKEKQKLRDAEKEVDEDVRAGRVKTFDNADNLMKDLEQ